MVDLLYDPTRVFKFNLLPPKTKEEIDILVDRDNSSLYAFILVFASIFIFILLNIFQLVLVQPHLDLTLSNIQIDNTQIKSYDPLKKVNGELFIKATTLEPILNLDIKLTRILDIGKQIEDKVPNVTIINYSRLDDGTFILTFKLSSLDQAETLVDAMKSIGLSNVFLKDLSSSNGEFSTNISFSISNLNG